MRRLGGRAGAALALPACVVAAFAPALFGTRVFFQRDVLSYWYPQTTVLRRALADRSWPLWNPWLGFGASLIADSSTQLAYPPTWLVLVLPLAVQFKLIAAGHCLLAAAGACALGRRLGLGWTGGATAGVAYALSGPLLSAVSLFHHYAGAAWMPWLLWALLDVLRRPGPARSLWLGALGGLQVLAGSGDMLLFAALTGLIFAAGPLARTPSRAALAATVRSLLVAAVLALAIGAVQWLPTAERASAGFRPRQDARTSTYWSTHPLSAADLAVPRLVSDLPLTEPWRQQLNEGREPLLSCLYLGVVTLALALLALVLGPGPASPAAAAAAFFLAASLGRHTPLYALLLELPGFGLLRYPQKFLVPASLCVALLAAAGVHAWGREWAAAERRRARVLAAALAIAPLAALVAWWLVQRTAWLAGMLGPADAAVAAHAAGLKLARSVLLSLAVAALLWRRGASARPLPAGLGLALAAGALDLVVVAHGTLALAPAALAEQRPAVLGRAGVEPGARVHAALERPECLAIVGGPAAWQPEWRAALAFQQTLRPPTGARWAVLGSFDGEFTGLGSPWASALTRVVDDDLASAGALRLLRLAGVDRVLRVGRRPVAGLELLDEIDTPYACPLQLLRVPAPLPRARIVHEARAASGVDATLALLVDPGFDPGREVVLEAEPAGALDGAAASRRPEPGRSEPALEERVEWLSRGLDELALSAQLRSPGWLVVSEAFDPGWQATVDGQAARVWRANGVFRAVRLEAGQDRVRFSYRPWSARLGAALTACGVLAAATLAATLRQSRRRARIAAARAGR